MKLLSSLRRRSGLALLALAGLTSMSLGFESPARADDRVFGGSWRRSAEKASRKKKLPDTGFAAELRVGAYKPEVDSTFSGKGPYEQVFGDAARVYAGLEVDWQPLRVPYLGTLGPALGWGFTRSSAKALITGTTDRSGQSTTLTIFPMHASGVIRLDELQQ